MNKKNVNKSLFIFLIFVVFTIIPTNMVFADDIIMKNIEVDEAYKIINSNVEFILIDLRTPSEYEAAHIEGAININFNSDTFQDEIGQLDKEKMYVIYCGTGGRSGKAFAIMGKMGFQKVYNMLGGINKWTANDYGVLPSPVDKITEISATQFDNEVLKSSKPVLLDIYANWCRPCKDLSPIMEEVAEQLNDKVKFVKIDGSIEFDALSAKGIEYVEFPTIRLYQNGEIIKQIEPNRDKDFLVNSILEALK